ncbi:hypothetical protein GGF46_002970 [Coemansia sp. RSA 552]|nr:hypothetical protein GGF46_002970 [Coemansia sp. RSA 552]
MARQFATWTVPKNWFAQFYYIGTVVGLALLLDVALCCGLHSGSRLLRPPVGVVARAMATLEQKIIPWRTNGSAYLGIPDMPALVALLMYNAHVLVRLKETVVDQPTTSAKIHIGQYFVGIFFYTATPLALVIDAFAPEGWQPVPAWATAAAAALFVYASIHQWRCHHILYSLRRQSKQYMLPAGDLFELVSSPHYFCEILVYISIWMATGCQSPSALCVVLWTAVNLGVTARESQIWYHDKFGAQLLPQNRRALIPFIW